MCVGSAFGTERHSPRNHRPSPLLEVERERSYDASGSEVRRPSPEAKVVFVLGGTAPLVVQALGNFASSVRGALIRLFALRGVSQAIGQTAPKIAPAIDLPASPTAFQATEPLPAADEAPIGSPDAANWPLEMPGGRPMHHDNDVLVS